MTATLYAFCGGSDPAFQFVLHDNGHIACLECRYKGVTYWCSHLEEAMTKRWDQKAIWENGCNLSAFKFQIPVFPTKNLWTEVLLDYRPNQQARIWWKGNYVCTINEGEGRNIIRGSLIEYMLGNVDYSQCKSSTHGWGAQRVWEKDILNPDMRYAQLWSVFAESMCLTCLQALNSPDAVPASENTGVWN